MREINKTSRLFWSLSILSAKHISFEKSWKFLKSNNEFPGGLIKPNFIVHSVRIPKQIIIIIIYYFYYIYFPSTMALGLTQPLTDMSTRNISWGIKAAGV